jgi:hypothetical protein
VRLCRPTVWVTVRHVTTNLHLWRWQPVRWSGLSATLRFLWDGLSANERRVLAAVASRLSPYQAQARAMAGLASASSAQRAGQALLERAILEREDGGGLRIVDPLLARWVRRHAGARISVYVVPQPGGSFVVTDGPPVASARSQPASLEEAEQEADRIAAGRAGADVMVHDTDDPSRLGGRPVGARSGRRAGQLRAPEHYLLQRDVEDLRQAVVRELEPSQEVRPRHERAARVRLRARVGVRRRLEAVFHLERVHAHHRDEAPARVLRLEGRDRGREQHMVALLQGERLASVSDQAHTT